MLGVPRRAEDSPVIFAACVLGETGLYKWQMRALEHAARGERVALRAANGSGKTDKVVGILALWFLWRYPRGRMPITSGSWRQVKNQLWPALFNYVPGNEMHFLFSNAELPSNCFPRVICMIFPANLYGYRANSQRSGWNPA